MKEGDQIERCFRFLTRRAESGESFSLEDLAQATTWTLVNTRTNVTKRLTELLREQGKRFVARPEILRVRAGEFRDLFGQKRRLFADYTFKETTNVLVYEFFMPLAREDRLREALDNLFYTDTIEQRIREIGLSEIRSKLDLKQGLPASEVKSVVLDLVEDTIGGYSIQIVNGRFRAGQLQTRGDVADRAFSEGPYLVDEMTAIVRFILPLESGDGRPAQASLFEPAKPGTVAERADQVRWLFLNFFAEAVTR